MQQCHQQGHDNEGFANKLAKVSIPDTFGQAF